MLLGLKGLIIKDKDSEFHNQKVDLLIEDGIITEIGKLSFSNNTQVEQFENGTCISVGWTDLRANFADPGLEFREDLESGSNVAISGGITSVGVVPNTIPIIANKGDVEYVRASNYGPKLLPIASFTRTTENFELTDLADLEKAGVAAFCQLPKTYLPNDVLIRAMEYIRVVNKHIHFYANDTSSLSSNFMHEGQVNVQLGIKGTPSIAEALNIERLIKYAEYTGAQIHIMNVSTSLGINLIRNAKNAGQKITADTCIYNLLYTDQILSNFNTAFKLDPPLRDQTDKVALLQACKDGTIDAISSNHEPLEEDLKKCELPLAEFGSIGTQTLFSALLLAFEGDLDFVVEILSKRNTAIYQSNSQIKVGEKTDLSIFNPTQKWRFDELTNRSKSSNSVFMNKELTGKPLAIVSNGIIYHA